MSKELPALTIPKEWKEDRAPPLPPNNLEEMCKRRCRTTLLRLQSWLDSGTGNSFSTLHEQTAQDMFPTDTIKSLQEANFTVVFEGNKLIVTKEK